MIDFLTVYVPTSLQYRGKELRKKNRGCTHQVIEIKKYICTAEIPILPDTYMGIQITWKESIGYVDKGIDDERGRHQCNNLIYSAQQIPDREKCVVCNNGWGK